MFLLDKNTDKHITFKFHFIYIWWLLIQKMKSRDSVLKIIVVGERDTTIPTCVEAITDVMETVQVTNPL